ncbi:MAG: hypothetical protein M3463_17360 [Verrucomicrobiota bacterium]|nr:hypothetical protein [Verrucomicrobiota bacterium]
MKPLRWSWLFAFALPWPAAAEDLKSPKPDGGRTIRVLLHLSGSERLIDYSDVYRLHSNDSKMISFETSDGFLITHHGSYTLILEKNAAGSSRAVPPGQRFFDPK